jgi:hypothetical protein
MTTVFDGLATGSPRASCVFMARSYTGQPLVRNLHCKTFPIPGGYAPASQKKAGHVLVRTPGGRKSEFQPEKGAMSGGLNLQE